MGFHDKAVMLELEQEPKTVILRQYQFHFHPTKNIINSKHGIKVHVILPQRIEVLPEISWDSVSLVPKQK